MLVLKRFPAHMVTRAIFVLTITLSFFNIWDMRVASAACAINGQVYVDYNSNGAQDLLEPGQARITVRAYAPDGSVADTTTTAADGTYSLAVAATMPQVRIEFGDTVGSPGAIPTWLRSGPFGGLGGESDTTVTFVDCTVPVSNGVDLGLVSPGEYCHTINPDLGIGCYVSGDQFAAPVAGQPTLVTFPYTSGSGNNTPPFNSPGPYDAPAHSTMAFAPNIGTTFGIAYQRSSDSFFVSSYVKRHTGLGPNATGSNTTTTGGIYRIDRRTAVPTVTTFIDLNALAAINTGADPHTLPYNVDAGAFDAVGKLGLGDLDVSEDDTTLYTVNLNSKTLISIPIAAPTTASSRAIPNPGCTRGEFRPFGLAVHHNLVYIGSVCDASGAGGTAADLEAIVTALNPNTGATAQVLRFPLNYPRRCGDKAPGCMPTESALWHPWINTWTFTQQFIVYPQPMLSDIDFDSTGDMILGFRDRWGDQSGANQRSPTFPAAPFNGLYSGITAGDVLRACINAAGSAWNIEQNATCGTITTAGSAGSFIGQGPGTPGGEYYFSDNIAPNPYADLHDEISIGGILQLPGSPDVAAVAFDPVPNAGQTFDGGVIWMNNLTGARTRSYRIYDSTIGNAIFFGKANGLGSLEAACGPAPIEIGNRVWEDLDRNGQQDPGEMPIPGVVVSLYDAANAPIAKTTTNVEGEYIFNAADVFNAADARTWFHINSDNIADANEPRGIMPNTDYTIRLDDPANYAPGGPLVAKNYYATTLNTVVDQRDSDGTVTSPLALVSTTNAPSVSLRTGEFGENNHTYDFGFSILPTTVTATPGATQAFTSSTGFTLSKTVDTPFAGPGATVTWTLTIANPYGVPATNVTVTDNVPSQLTIIPPVTTTSSSGTVTVNGQLVTFSQGLLNPGETVLVVIKTRVNASVSAPFVITNETCCAPGSPPASAQIISANRLPATGDSWFGQFRLPLLLIGLSLGLLLIVRLVERRRGRAMRE